MKTRMNGKGMKKGFTLIELLVVVAIIGVLTAIAVPKFGSMTDGAAKNATLANHRIIVSAISMYIADNDGKKPAQSTDLDKYITGGFAGLQGKPDGAAYTFNASPSTGGHMLESKLGSASIATFTP